jgi:hypothetical protein
MWYNLMSYKYRDIILKSGQVILGHHYFDMSEKIVIEEYKLLFKTPLPHQEYHDGHLIQSFYDIRANRPAEIMSKDAILGTVDAMIDDHSKAEDFIKQHKTYFKDLCDLDAERDSAGVEFDSLYIPWVSPMEDYKDSADRTIEKINQATNEAGLFGGFKLTPWHLLLALGALVLATKFMHLW